MERKGDVGYSTCEVASDKTVHSSKNKICLLNQPQHQYLDQHEYMILLLVENTKRVANNLKACRFISYELADYWFTN